jgi:hypothetical protein
MHTRALPAQLGKFDFDTHWQRVWEQHKRLIYHMLAGTNMSPRLRRKLGFGHIFALAHKICAQTMLARSVASGIECERAMLNVSTPWGRLNPINLTNLMFGPYSNLCVKWGERVRWTS